MPAKNKLRKYLNVGEKVLILVKETKKKYTPGKCYKQTVQNISYFNKKALFTIRNSKNWQTDLLLGKKYWK